MWEDCTYWLYLFLVPNMQWAPSLYVWGSGFPYTSHSDTELPAAPLNLGDPETSQSQPVQSWADASPTKLILGVLWKNENKIKQKNMGREGLLPNTHILVSLIPRWTGERFLSVKWGCSRTFLWGLLREGIVHVPLAQGPSSPCRKLHTGQLLIL